MDRLLNMLDQKALMVETMKEVEEAASSALADKVQWDHNSLLGLSYEEKCNFLKLRELDFLNAVKLQLIKNRKLRFQKLKNEQKLIEEESKSTQPDSTIAISERNSTSSSDAVQLETDTKPQCSTAVEEVCQLINEGEILRKHNRDLQCLKSEITTRLKFKKERADLFELYLEIRKRKNMLNLKKNQEKKANKSKKQYADLLFEVQESKGWRNKGPLVSRMMRCIMGCREDLRNFLRSESKLKGEESELEDDIDPETPWLMKKEKIAMHGEKRDELSSVAFTNSSPNIPKETEDFIDNFFKFYKKHLRLPRDAHLLEELQSIAFQQAKHRSVNVDGSVGTFEVDEVDKESDWEKQSAEVNEENHLPTETVLSSGKVHVEVLLIDDSDEKYHELEIASNQFMEMDEAAVENWNVAAADYPEASSAVENVAYVIEQNDNGEEVITLIDDTDEYVIDDSNNTQYDGQQYLYADSLCMLPDTGNAFHGYYVENQLEQPMPEYIEHYENEPMLSQAPDQLYFSDPMLSAGSDTLPFYESGLNDDMNLDQCYFETNNNAQYALFPNYNTDNSDGYVIDSQWVGAAAEEYFQQQQYPDFGIIEEQSSESEEQDADQI
ncbi:hypothetical protein Tsp_11190 [Trichinella spiralis]|uniref:hypothetical protein n=1 Tax=Trichinella spiralis TaxID=6334 RepID=UPI0001EFEEA3|nr:hypothetical protein Tsp_11190 [Trichinella spiralis]